MVKLTKVNLTFADNEIDNYYEIMLLGGDYFYTSFRVDKEVITKQINEFVETLMNRIR
jgi:hypothetical protein